VEELMFKVEEKVPVLLPAMVGEMAVMLEQTDGYVTVAVGMAVTM
jgi:hypothetical protein